MQEGLTGCVVPNIPGLDPAPNGEEACSRGSTVVMACVVTVEHGTARTDFALKSCISPVVVQMGPRSGQRELLCLQKGIVQAVIAQSQSHHPLQSATSEPGRSMIGPVHKKCLHIVLRRPISLTHLQS